jgi:hypothetical protein
MFKTLVINNERFNLGENVPSSVLFFVELYAIVEEKIPHRKIFEPVQVFVERNPQNISKKFTITVLECTLCSFKLLYFIGLYADGKFEI